LPEGDRSIHRVVSSEDELLVLVDEEGNTLGSLSKGACHDGEGVLHLAFSIFIFNGRGELLLQQRSADKRLWGGFWSNSCCSHPRWGERMDEAIHRRLEQELGFDTELEYLFTFTYHARFGEAGSERERCSVFVGRHDGPVAPNATEIDSWRWIAPAELDAEMEAHPERFTPWFQEEWPRVRAAYRSALALDGA